MTKEEIGQILKELRLSCGKTQKEVAELLGRKQQIVGHWETGYAQPDANTLFTLCDIYGTTVDAAFGFKKANLTISKKDVELLQKYQDLDDYGRETIDIVLEREIQRVKALSDKGEKITELSEKIKELNIPKRLLVYYGKIAAAGKSFVFDDVIAGTKEYPLTDVNKNADYTIGISGDSMEPTYYDGDIVYVQKTNHLNIGDIGIFQKDNGIYIKEAGENGLISHNSKKYNPMVNGGDVICLGKVLGKAEEN